MGKTRLNYNLFESHQESIAVIGLGYVGLPLAVNLSKYFQVVGYDLCQKRIQELQNNYDRTLEIEKDILAQSSIKYTNDPNDIQACGLIIIAVPTPINKHRIPDLNPLKSATDIVGQNMKPDTCIVYESTVYPGLTEEICVPRLEKKSGLIYQQEFTVGYSPERINPGDKIHTLDKIIKIVSGSTPETLEFLCQIYGRIVPAGVHPVSSIKVAEAAKVIENTQRDINIALMNELAMIFDYMGIDTQEVLDASSTKWNFLPFKPGLVGGHCIGVDPYYLTFKAESLGYHPEMILAGRRINDSMGKYVAERTVKLLIASGKPVNGSNVAVLGITFKENVPDLRNTKVLDIIRELKDYGVNVFVHDPFADSEEAKTHCELSLRPLNQIHHMNAVIVCVMHRPYIDMGLKGLIQLLNPKEKPIIIDVKGAFNPEEASQLGINYWRL